jgi:hypothetical protein
VANKEYVERLQMVIEQLHKCRATHKTSVYVKEEFRGKTAWEGDVEVFSIFGHPKAKFCYGWSYGEPEQFIATLELPPVDSPQSAVKAGVAYQVKQAMKGKK